MVPFASVTGLSRHHNDLCIAHEKRPKRLYISLAGLIGRFTVNGTCEMNRSWETFPQCIHPKMTEGKDMATHTTTDQAKTEAFLGKVLSDTSGLTTTIMASIGDRLGLFRNLVESPATIE